MKTDFLVIGSGAAGLSFALKAAEAGHVTIVTKGEMVECNTNYAQGGICSVTYEPDTFEKHIHDTMVCGAGICDPEAVDLVVRRAPELIADLIAWGAIGARTTESQSHRQLASGSSCPIGFKNGTDGNIRIATDAIQAAARGHHFLSVHKNGQVAIVQTNGNKDCHVILRGGKAPNYDAESVAAAGRDLEAAGLRPTLMVDCSHANSSKQHQKQIEVASDIANQIATGSRHVFGVMVESHLTAGAQKFTPGVNPIAGLEYGKSITDACIGWDDSEQVLETLAQAVKSRRG
jgi:3-deoxy-7-phosphoheptulonate synthase